MTNVLPMLSGEGWLTDPQLTLNRLYAHMFLSDHAQTNVFAGKVTSLQYLIALYGHSPSELSTQVARAVKTYVGRYFDNVECTFELNEDLSSESYGVYDFQMGGSRDGQYYDLSRTLKADTSTGTLQFIEALSLQGFERNTSQGD